MTAMLAARPTFRQRTIRGVRGKTSSCVTVQAIDAIGSASKHSVTIICHVRNDTNVHRQAPRLGTCRNQHCHHEARTTDAYHGKIY